MKSVHVLAHKLCLPVLTLLLFLATGCDLLGNEDEEIVTSGVYVTNQGVFGSGSGSITIFDPVTGATSTPETFRGHGAIYQSAEFFGGRLYATANNGDRVHVYDIGTNTLIDSIRVRLPRYMALINPGKMYVTSQTFYYGSPSFVTIVDPRTLEAIDTVEVGGNAEQIALVGDRAYVTTGAFDITKSVVVIDTKTDRVVQTVDLECDAPRYVQADSDGDVFVVCTGTTLYDENFNPVGRTNGAIVVLDGKTGTVTDRIDVDAQLGTGGVGQDAYYASEVSELYVIKEGNRVLRIDTKTNRLVAEIGPISGGDLGAVAYDGLRDHLYLSHIPSYADPGTVTLHDRNGAQVGQFTVGVAPVYITFRREGR